MLSSQEKFMFACVTCPFALEPAVSQGTRGVYAACATEDVPRCFELHPPKERKIQLREINIFSLQGLHIWGQL